MLRAAAAGGDARGVEEIGRIVRVRGETCRMHDVLDAMLPHRLDITSGGQLVKRGYTVGFHDKGWRILAESAPVKEHAQLIGLAVLKQGGPPPPEDKDGPLSLELNSMIKIKDRAVAVKAGVDVRELLQGEIRNETYSESSITHRHGIDFEETEQFTLIGDVEGGQDEGESMIVSASFAHVSAIKLASHGPGHCWWAFVLSGKGGGFSIGHDAIMRDAPLGISARMVRLHCEADVAMRALMQITQARETSTDDESAKDFDACLTQFALLLAGKRPALQGLRQILTGAVAMMGATADATTEPQITMLGAAGGDKRAAGGAAGGDKKRSRKDVSKYAKHSDGRYYCNGCAKFGPGRGGPASNGWASIKGPNHPLRRHWSGEGGEENCTEEHHLLPPDDVRWPCGVKFILPPASPP